MMNAKKYSLLFFLFLALAGILADRVSGYYALEYHLMKTPAGRGPLFSIATKGLEGLLGDYFWVKADDYYHGGASDIAMKCRGLGAGTDNHDESPEGHARQQGHTDFIQKINSVIVIDEHIHLSGQEIKELLPWFRLATLLNPHNVEAYVNGSFWLARKLGQPQEAERFLKEGVENNPGDYRLYNEMAFLYCYEGDLNKAIEFLNKAESLWKNENDPSVNERASAYAFLGDLYEKTGDYDKAIYNYKKFLNLFPKNQKIKDKIKEIKQGRSKSEAG